MTDLLLFVFLIFSILLTRSVTVLIHEYGHALPALLFTRERVTVYVGNYGNPAQTILLRLGRLHTYFSYDILNLNAGVCEHRGAVSIFKSMLITLGGPLASLLFSGLLWYLYAEESINNVGRMILAIWAASALLDFFINIIPSPKVIELHNGTLIRNDGYKLKIDWYALTLPVEFTNGLNYYHTGQFNKAFNEFSKLKGQNIHKRFIYEMMMTCLWNIKDYKKALKLSTYFLKYFKGREHNFSLFSKLHLKEKNFKEAHHFADKALQSNYTNAEYLCLRGEALMELEYFKEAGLDFNNALRSKPDYADAYALRGLLLSKTGNYGAAQADFRRALELDENNLRAHFYISLGQN